MSTMPAASVSGEVTACSQPRSLRLDLLHDGGEVLAEVVRGVGGVGRRVVPRRGGSVCVPSVQRYGRRDRVPQPASARIGGPGRRDSGIRGGRRRYPEPVGTFKDAVKRVLYPAYEARLVRQLEAPGRLPQARRGDARRQPALGARGRRRHRRRAPRRRGQHLAVPRLVRRARHRGGHAVAALDRQPQPARRGARAAAGHHRGRRHRARRRRALADQPRRRARPAAGRTTARVLKDAADAHARRRRHPGQHRGRLRRPPRDRRRRAVAAAAPRRAGHLDRGARRASSTSSTSPSTSTPRASPTPTW